MEDYHNFYFQRANKAIKNFFVFSLFSLILTLVASLLRFESLLPKTLYERYEFCLSDMSTLKIINFMKSWLSNVSFLPIILICMAVIYQKSSDDPLQKVNKLDSLAKVSIFQCYKEVKPSYMKLDRRINE